MSEQNQVSSGAPIWSCSECVRRVVEDDAFARHLVDDHGWDVAPGDLGRNDRVLINRCAYCRQHNRWIGLPV